MTGFIPGFATILPLRDVIFAQVMMHLRETTIVILKSLIAKSIHHVMASGWVALI
jgi:hypothetical protein